MGTKEVPGGIVINRRPADMETWEVIATYRLAWNLAQYSPAKPLDKALSNWLAVARQALEERGEWRPDTLPPQSM
jgi:hypothetical protein